MLFIGIVIVLLAYAALYLIWDRADISTTGVQGVLRSLQEAFLRPGNEVFFILRSLLILALLYVIADHFVSAARRALKRKQQEPEQMQATFRENNDHIYKD